MDTNKGLERPIRKCNVCGLQSDKLDLFVKGRRHRYGRRNKCKECNAVYRDDIRSSLSSERIAANKAYYHRVAKRNRGIMNAAKSAPCTDCGVQYHPVAMDFDHLDAASKKTGVGNMLSYSEKVLREEIAKCEVVCANCHRIRTYKRKQKAHPDYFYFDYVD